MKKSVNFGLLPWIILVLGLCGYGLRRWLYLAGTDGRGLIPSGHPLSVALWCLTAGTLLLIGIAVWQLDGDRAFQHNFFPSLPGAVGHMLAAAGILTTVLSHEPLMPGSLGSLWLWLGLGSVPCLLAAGCCRLLGKKPFFLLHMVPCLFLVIHIVNHYQTWSSLPQLQDYFFPMFSNITLMFFVFYTAAFDEDISSRRMQLGMGLSALYLCLANLPTAQMDFWLHLGGMAWILTGLCTFHPKPLPPKEKKKEGDGSP